MTNICTPYELVQILKGRGYSSVKLCKGEVKDGVPSGFNPKPFIYGKQVAINGRLGSVRIEIHDRSDCSFVQYLKIRCEYKVTVYNSNHTKYRSHSANNLDDLFCVLEDYDLHRKQPLIKKAVKS